MPPSSVSTLAMMQLAVVSLQQRKAHPAAYPEFWESQGHSTIHTETRGDVPFVPFGWQRAFADGLTRRELILKSRDVGSSEISIRALCYKMLRDGGNLLIKADKEKNAINLVRIARHYLMSLPVEERPRLVKDNETELELAGVGMVRAMARGGGRSERCRYMILTERAWWEDSPEEIADVSGALVADGYLIVESTARGFNEFHGMWADELSGYRKTFVGRWDNPTHTAEWWLDKQAEMVATPNLLPQEYPQTPEEAFVASGLTLFDKVAILARQAKCREAETTERLTIGGHGFLKTWAPPVPGHTYCMGADVAEGKDAGNDRLDYSGAAVYDIQTVEHVADLHGQWGLDIFAKHLDTLGRRYQDAQIGVERNNHGHAVLLELRHLNYPHIYAHAGSDDLHGRGHVAELGWPSTMVTKPILEQELGAGIARGWLKSWDKAFWDECLSYVNLGNGRSGAQPGSHDDRVVKHGIALQMRKHPVWRVDVSLPIHYTPPTDPRVKETAWGKARRMARRKRLEEALARGG